RQGLEVARAVRLEQPLLVEAVKAAHHRSHRCEWQRKVLHERRPHLLLRLWRRARGTGRRRITLTLVGWVTFQLGIDQTLVGADAGQRLDDRPAEGGGDP